MDSAKIIEKDPWWRGRTDRKVLLAKSVMEKSVGIRRIICNERNPSKTVAKYSTDLILRKRDEWSPNLYKNSISYGGGKTLIMTVTPSGVGASV